jgi:glutaminyl-peptide cyclotransferase
VLAVTALAAALAVACASPPPDPSTHLKPQVIARIPHDRTAFTEGLDLVGGVLYEGTGLPGRSRISTVDPATGQVTRTVALPGPLFGEGVAVVGDRIWQLTWKNGVAVERDRATLTELRRLRYSGEGWGLCYDGTRLVMSEGSNRLIFRDPRTFDQIGEVRVTLGGAPVTQLNELDCSGGVVWANVWQTDQLVRIDPGTGVVGATVDASGLLSGSERDGVDVLNGITAVPGTDQFLITGKFWPLMLRVRFVPS